MEGTKKRENEILVEKRNKCFSQKISKIISENKMNRETFAKSIGVSESLICRYLKKERFPTGEVIYRIAKTYNLSVDWLIGRSKKKNISNPNNSDLPPALGFSIRYYQLLRENNMMKIEFSKKYQELAHIKDAKTKSFTYKHAEMVPNIGSLIIISDIFGVSIDYVLNLTDEKNS